MAWPFQKPVDIEDVPNYHKIISDPMGKMIKNIRIEI
jgi:hypothetical protein